LSAVAVFLDGFADVTRVSVMLAFEALNYSAAADIYIINNIK